MQLKKMVPLALAAVITTTAVAGAANLPLEKKISPSDVYSYMCDSGFRQNLLDKYFAFLCGQFPGNCPEQKPEETPEETPDVEQPEETPDVEQPEETPDVEQPEETPDVEQPEETPDVEQPEETPDVEQPEETPDNPPQLPDDNRSEETRTTPRSRLRRRTTTLHRGTMHRRLWRWSMQSAPNTACPR